MRPLAAACCCLVALTSSGCAQKVLVKTPQPGARVTLGAVQDEPVTEEGVRVKVPPGLSPVPFVVEDERGRREGVIERTEVQWAFVAAGVVAAACCAPSLVAGGACLANPALAPAAVGCAIAASPAPCFAVLAAPSWATVPLAGAGGLLGLSPLALALLSEQVPDEVVLEGDVPAGAAPPTREAAVPY